MADPKIKEKRWTVDLEKKIQEAHFAEGQRYTFNKESMIPTRCKQTTYSTSLGSLFAIKRRGTYEN